MATTPAFAPDALPIPGRAIYLHTIAREFAELPPWQTLQITPHGRYLERRFKVPRDAAVIARTLAPYDPEEYQITCTRFAPDDDLVLLHVVSIQGHPADLTTPTAHARGGAPVRR